MADSLKKSLEILKARAKRLSLRARSGTTGEGELNLYLDGTDGGTFPPASPEGLTGGDFSYGADMLAVYKTGEPKALEDVQPGKECSIDGQPFYLIRSVGSEVDLQAPVEAEVYGHLCSWPQHVAGRVFPARPAGRRSLAASKPAQFPKNFDAVGSRGRKLPPFDPESLCFLDIETTGLSPNTYMFLCGFMFFEKGEFVVEQVFARNYAEETGVLLYVRELLNRVETVVTYNGDKFDLPFIQTRMAVNRVPAPEPFASVDLLYTARRVFAGTLPNNKLGTVERHLRGIKRTGDIPGKHIPEAYHDYVRSGDGRAIKNVLYHNRMDLFTMAVLIDRLAMAETG